MSLLDDVNLLRLSFPYRYISHSRLRSRLRLRSRFDPALSQRQPVLVTTRPLSEIAPQSTRAPTTCYSYCRHYDCANRRLIEQRISNLVLTTSSFLLKSPDHLACDVPFAKHIYKRLRFAASYHDYFLLTRPPARLRPPFWRHVHNRQTKTRACDKRRRTSTPAYLDKRQRKCHHTNSRSKPPRRQASILDQKRKHKNSKRVARHLE